MGKQRLIDAHALEWRFTAIAVGQSDSKIKLVKAICEIRDAPTVDAVPVVNGRWVHHYYDSGEPIDDKWYCSECHMCNDHKRTWYCPNCGAKMEKGGANDEI